MKPKSTQTAHAITLGLVLVGQSAFAAVILDGAATFPGTSNVLTTTATTDSRSVRATNPARDVAQSFRVSTSFTLDAIYIKYSSAAAYTDGTFNLRIFQVADTLATGNAAPASVGSDLLNISITLNFTTRAAANFIAAGTTTPATLKFDLTGADEISLPALAGSAGYVIMFDTPASGITSNSLFDWRGDFGGYANGRMFDSTTDKSGSDGSLALVAVPEPNVAALLGSLGVLTVLRRRRYPQQARDTFPKVSDA
jgi:hypothetical protein